MKQARAERRQRRLEACEIVPNAPLRKRFLELNRTEGLSLHDVCMQVGFVKHPKNRPPVGDTSYLQRLLGLRADTRGPRDRSVPTPRETIKYELAVRLAEVLEMDPHEAGV